jgi:hypothetical protein
MWHPFDIMPQDLAVDDALKTAAPGDHCRLVYGERVVRWFKDKSSADSQWPPTVDKKPGLVLTRRPGSDGTWDLDLQQTWVLTNTQTMSGKMTCRRIGWRSPLSWEFQQSFQTSKGKEFLPGLTERGSWRDGELLRVTSGASGEVEKTDRAAELAATYALLADFPKEGEATGDTGLLQENLGYSPRAGFVPCSKALQENPLARGLRGSVLKNEGGYPADFWTNPAGVVIYACYGPNRVFVLEKAEAVS